jgi:hypothetical protein
MEVEAIKYSTGQIVDEANVIISNHNQLMTVAFVGKRPQNQTARVYKGILDEDNRVLGVLKVFEGVIDDWKIDEDQVEFSISSAFNRWAQRVNTKHSISCRWKVFGCGPNTRCGYTKSEGETCDRSYSNCLRYNNTANFGGFRFIPQAQTDTWRWGPNASQYRNMY